MFSEGDWEQIILKSKGMEGHCLEIIMRTPYGPTAVDRYFEDGLRKGGIDIIRMFDWGSGASSFGVLEIEIEGDRQIYAVWSQGEVSEVIKITPRIHMEIKMILDSMASSNVAPGVMRTFSHARFPGG